MARYAYKSVCYELLPTEYADNFELRHGREFDADANYDGDYWYAVGDYIEDLLEEIKQLKGDK